jgi:hypothetical protein
MSGRSTRAAAQAAVITTQALEDFNARLNTHDETQQHILQTLAEMSNLMRASQTPGLGAAPATGPSAAPAAAPAAPVAALPNPAPGGSGTNAGGGLDLPPTPAAVAPDAALREALARQAAARAVVDAADREIASLRDAATAASSSSSSSAPHHLPAQLAAAATDAAGRDDAILEAARLSFNLGAHSSGKHPEQQSVDAINTLYTAERSKIDSTIFNIYESKLKARELNEKLRLLVTSITLLKKLGTRLVDVALNVTTDQRAQLETAVQLVQCMVEEHENRKLVADGEVLMVGYADDCSSLEKYDEAVRKRWAATANDPKQLSKTITDFLGSPVYKSLLRSTTGTGAGGNRGGGSGSSSGTKRDSSSAFGGASRAGSSAGSSAGARGGKGKGPAKKRPGGGGGPVTSE